MIISGPPSLTPVETYKLKQELKNLYNTYDADQNGVLDQYELRILINDLRDSFYLPRVSKVQFSNIVDILDANNDNQIQLQELLENFDRCYNLICGVGEDLTKTIKERFDSLNINENNKPDRYQVYELFKTVAANIGIIDFDKWVSDYILDNILNVSNKDLLHVDDVLNNYRFIVYKLKNPTDMTVCLNDQFGKGKICEYKMKKRDNKRSFNNIDEALNKNELSCFNKAEEPNAPLLRRKLTNIKPKKSACLPIPYTIQRHNTIPIIDQLPNDGKFKALKGYQISDKSSLDSKFPQKKSKFDYKDLEENRESLANIEEFDSNSSTKSKKNSKLKSKSHSSWSFSNEEKSKGSKKGLEQSLVETEKSDEHKKILIRELLLDTTKITKRIEEVASKKLAKFNDLNSDCVNYKPQSDTNQQSNEVLLVMKNQPIQLAPQNHTIETKKSLFKIHQRNSPNKYNPPNTLANSPTKLESPSKNWESQIRDYQSNFQKEIFNKANSFKMGNIPSNKSDPVSETFIKNVNISKNRNLDAKFFSNFGMESLYGLSDAANSLKQNYQQELEQIIDFLSSLRSFIRFKINTDDDPCTERIRSGFKGQSTNKKSKQNPWIKLYNFITPKNPKKNTETNLDSPIR